MRYPHEWQQLTPIVAIASHFGRFYVALPATKAGPATREFPATHSEITDAAHPDVHLVPSRPPVGTLEVAPRTSLRQDSTRERWEGFWCIADDRYYARCARPDGTSQWFRFADERVRTQRETRVLPLRHRGWGGNRSTLLVGAYGGRAIIVGRSRRRDRGPTPEGAR